jgi:hypothetical protein
VGLQEPVDGIARGEVEHLAEVIRSRFVDTQGVLYGCAYAEYGIMSTVSELPLKPVVWVGDSLRVLRTANGGSSAP